MADRVHRARGVRRREQLLRAALEVIGERGVQATTHRAIAEAARVPTATTTYYFRSLDELLEEALRLFVADEVGRLRDAAARVVDVDGGTGDIIRAVAAELRDASSAAQLDLYVAASRRPALRPVVAESLEAYRAVAEGLLRRVGAREPERAAPLVVALVDGLALQHVAVGDPLREERIVEGLEALLTPFLARDKA